MSFINYVSVLKSLLGKWVKTLWSFEVTLKESTASVVDTNRIILFPTCLNASPENKLQ